MVVIKTDMNELPRSCDYCSWFSCRPHPYKGWSDNCELMSHCMDDDQPEEWIWDGNDPPKACPLMEVLDESIVPRKDDTDESLSM